MGQFTGVSLAIAILDLIGSFSSSLGAGFIAICYLILPFRRHFRHSLILNLAIADLLNGVNNTLSGIYILHRRKDMSPGFGCNLNGLIGQITVQATDCSILAISIVTLLAITRKTSLGEENSRWLEALICASTWILPCITGFTALGLHDYSPVSGNWCWLTANPPYLRYVLTHGWRLVFIIAEVIMYGYLHLYLHKHFKNLKAAATNDSNAQSRSNFEMSQQQPSKIKSIFKERATQPDPELTGSLVHEAESFARKDSMEKGIISKRVEIETDFDSISTDGLPQPVVTTISSQFAQEKPIAPTMSVNPFAHHRVSLDEATQPYRPRKESTSRSRKVQKILLLNAYPAAYIILWIPGIINRLIEASGHSSKTTQVLQAATQFVGLANALTYGWNERIGRQLQRKFSAKQKLPEF